MQLQEWEAGAEVTGPMQQRDEQLEDVELVLDFADNTMAQAILVLAAGVKAVLME